MNMKETPGKDGVPSGGESKEHPTSDSVPPPAYEENSYLPINPGFCDLAWRERKANRIAGGGMQSSQYAEPCPECGLICGDFIPPSYRNDWPEWVDPSVNFRWESHIAVTVKEHRELLGCWICWEYEQKWVGAMLPDEWYRHMRRHFREDGYQPCRNVMGVMQRRRNCPVRKCPKIHS